MRALNEIAKERGQELAQLAIAWVLRDKRVTPALLGAPSMEQLGTNLDALANLVFTDEELARTSTRSKPASTSGPGPRRRERSSARRPTVAQPRCSGLSAVVSLTAPGPRSDPWPPTAWE